MSLVEYLFLSAVLSLFQDNNEQSRTLKEGTEVFITPDGIFCLPYEQILNLHIRFVSVLNEENQISGDEEELANLLRNAIPKEIIFSKK